MPSLYCRGSFLSYAKGIPQLHANNPCLTVLLHWNTWEKMTYIPIQVVWELTLKVLPIKHLKGKGYWEPLISFDDFLSFWIGTLQKWFGNKYQQENFAITYYKGDTSSENSLVRLHLFVMRAPFDNPFIGLFFFKMIREKGYYDPEQQWRLFMFLHNICNQYSKKWDLIQDSHHGVTFTGGHFGGRSQGKVKSLHHLLKELATEEGYIEKLLWKPSDIEFPIMKEIELPKTDSEIQEVLTYFHQQFQKFEKECCE